MLDVSDLYKGLRFAYDCVKMLVVPNTHQLMELYIQQRQFCHHAVWVGEVNLERLFHFLLNITAGTTIFLVTLDTNTHLQRNKNCIGEDSQFKRV